MSVKAELRDFENKLIAQRTFLDRTDLEAENTRRTTTEQAYQWQEVQEFSTPEPTTYRFGEQKVQVPDHDCDIHLVFPSGDILTIQARPSNADVNYNGSLDILLPKPSNITCWIGDDMQPAPKQEGLGEEHRVANQIVTELPGPHE